MVILDGPPLELELGNAVDAAVVWLHGLGMSGRDFSPWLTSLGMDGVRFVLPQAKLRPITIRGGELVRAWFDVLDMRSGVEREHGEEVSMARESIERIIAVQVERGIPARRIVLAGFSQGGALAFHTARFHEQQLGGVVVLGGYAIRVGSSHVQRPGAHSPLLICHGTDDSIVPLRAGQSLHRFAQECMLGPIEWREFSGGHRLRLDHLEVIGAALRSWLAKMPS